MPFSFFFKHDRETTKHHSKVKTPNKLYFLSRHIKKPDFYHLRQGKEWIQLSMLASNWLCNGKTDDPNIH